MGLPLFSPLESRGTRSLGIEERASGSSEGIASLARWFLPLLYKNAIADMGPCFKGWDAYYETTASCCRAASSSSSLLPLAARQAIEEAKRADKQEATRVGMKGKAVETKVEEMGGHWADKPRVDDEQRVVVDWRDASTVAKRRYTFVSSTVYSSVFETRIGTFLLTSFFFPKLVKRSSKSVFDSNFLPTYTENQSQSCEHTLESQGGRSRALAAVVS